MADNAPRSDQTHRTDDEDLSLSANDPFAELASLMGEEPEADQAGVTRDDAGLAAFEAELFGEDGPLDQLAPQDEALPPFEPDPASEPVDQPAAFEDFDAAPELEPDLVAEMDLEPDFEPDAEPVSSSGLEAEPDHGFQPAPVMDLGAEADEMPVAFTGQEPDLEPEADTEPFEERQPFFEPVPHAGLEDDAAPEPFDAAPEVSAPIADADLEPFDLPSFDPASLEPFGDELEAPALSSEPAGEAMELPVQEPAFEPEAAMPVFSVPAEAEPDFVPVPSVAAGESDLDLEAQLLAELGGGPAEPEEPAIEPVIEALAEEAVQPEPTPDLTSEARFAPEPELAPEPSARAKPVLSIEEELQALLAGDAPVSPAPEQTAFEPEEPEVSAFAEPPAFLEQDTEVVPFTAPDAETVAAEEPLHETPAFDVPEPAASFADEPAFGSVETETEPDPFAAVHDAVAMGRETEQVTDLGDEFDTQESENLIDAFDAAIEDEFEDLFADDLAGDFAEADGALTPEPAEPVADDVTASEAEPRRSLATPAAVVGGGLAALGSVFGRNKSDAEPDAEVSANAALQDEILAHLDPAPERPVGEQAETELSPLEELEALMAEDVPDERADAYPVTGVPPQPAANTDMPLVSARDIGSGEPSSADFVVPELPGGEPEPVAANAARDPFDDYDLDLDFGAPQAATTAAATASLSRAESALDEVLDDTEFEAALAQDMEFAGHDRNAGLGSADPLDDDIFGEADVAPVEDEAATQGSKRRGFVVAAVVAGIAVAGVLGVVSFTGGSGTTAEGPVTVDADPTPVRVEPDDPGGSTVPNQDRAVFDAASGNGTLQANQEELVTTSEEPVDIATAPGAALPSAIGEKADDRLTPDAATGTETVATDQAPAALAPRRVRTLVVRPDGTLVEQPAPAPAAQTTEVAAAQPATTAPAPVPAAEPATASTAAAEPAAPVATAEPQAAPTAEPVEETAAVPADTAPAPAETASTEPVPVRTVPVQQVNPPIVADRPADQPVTIVNPEAQTQVASAPQPAATPAAQQPAAASPFVVQIASVPSQAGAQTQAAALQQRYSNVLGSRAITIQRAEIEGRGTFFRVRVAADSRSDATALCERYKRAGGSCFVAR